MPSSAARRCGASSGGSGSSPAGKRRKSTLSSRSAPASAVSIARSRSRHHGREDRAHRAQANSGPLVGWLALVGDAGYANAAYAASLADARRAARAARCGGSLLVRRTPGLADARRDRPLPALRVRRLVGPGGRPRRPRATSSSPCRPRGRPVRQLGARASSTPAFPDLLVPVQGAPRRRPRDGAVARARSPHHRRNARERALRARRGRGRRAEPADMLDDWIALYDEPRPRATGSAGTAAFSPRASRAQLAVPGIVASARSRTGRPSARRCGSSPGDVAYYHLAAYTQRGYELDGVVRAVRDGARALRATRARVGSRSAPAPASTDAERRADALQATAGRRRRATAYLCGQDPDAGRATRSCSRGAADTSLLPRLPGRRIRMTEPRYQSIAAHYEACLEQHGDTHLGVDWPNADDVETRHRVMLDVIRRSPDAQPGAAARLRLRRRAPLRAHPARRRRRTSSTRGSTSPSPSSPSRARSSPARLVPVRRRPGRRRRGGAAALRLRGHERRLHREARAVVRRDARSSSSAMVARVFGLAELGHRVQRHEQARRLGARRPLPSPVRRRSPPSCTAEISRNFVFRNDYGLYEYTAYVYR